MGKQRKGEKLGTGKVTPVQIAYIVDRYLSDNSFTQTLATFRSESSILTSKTKFKEAPKSLLSLSDILDEYISLKEQKISLSHERVSLDQEKCRVEKLLQGMQAVIQSYQSVGTAASLTSSIPNQIPEVVAYGAYNASLATPMLPPPSIPENNRILVPANPSKNKRKCVGSVVGSSSIAKKSCTQIPISKPASRGTKVALSQNEFYGSGIQPTPYGQNGCSSAQGSSVAKCLFKPPNDSTSPQTPPQAFPTQIDSSDSPLETSPPITSPNVTILVITPTKNPAIASAKITEDHPSISSSPLKRSGKRDHIKYRLDFDDSTETPKPENLAPNVLIPPIETALDDMFDDIPDFDVLEQDFSLSEFLLDISLDSYPCHSESTSCITESLTSSLHELGTRGFQENAGSSHNPGSSFSGILSERDMNREDPFSLKPSNSIARCTVINSPGKRERGCFGDQENMP